MCDMRMTEEIYSELKEESPHWIRSDVLKYFQERPVWSEVDSVTTHKLMTLKEVNKIYGKRKGIKMFSKKKWQKEMEEKISNVDKYRIMDKITLENWKGELKKLISEYHESNNETLEKKLEKIRADVDTIKNPMGTIIKDYGFGSRNAYFYANKFYGIPSSVGNNITGYRKKGDYVEIR